MVPEPQPHGDPAPGERSPQEAPPAADAPPVEASPAPEPRVEAPHTDGPSADPPPATEPEASREPSAGAPAAESAGGPAEDPKPAADGKRGSLRERIALDRAARRARIRAQLVGPLPLIAFGLLAVVFGLWLARAPIYRQLARQGGQLGAWALGQLAELKDPGSFDLFVEQLGSSKDTAKYHHLVFQLGGRDAAPTEGQPVPPDVPEQVAAHLEVLRAGLSHDDPERRRGALRALLALRKRSWTRTEPLLTSAAGLLTPNQDLRTRCYAALLLTYSPAPASVRPALLKAALEDRSREVRRFAIEALANTDDPEVAASLQPALRDAAPEVRREAMLAVVRLGAPPSFEDLAAIYRSDPDVHKAQLLRALAKLDDPRVEELLLDGLTGHLPATRAAAIKGLRSRDGRAARKGIERALRDRDASVRLAAVDALAERSDGAQSAPALVDAITRAGGGWEELRRLHRALLKLTDGAVPDPIQSQASTWQRCADAWEAWLERQP